MTIKLVVSDLDGTLFGPELVFSSRLLRAVRLARERGVIVTIATGRGFSSALGFARQLGTDAPLICYQGALIRTQEGQTLYQAHLSREHLPAIIEFAQQQQVELSVYYDDEIYYTTRTREPAYYERWFSLPAHQVENLSAALPGDPIKFILMAQDRAHGDRLEAALRDFAAGRFEVTRSHDWFVEGVPLNVSKGSAVAWLARHLGIEQTQVMALGDNGNDRAMIAWAGLGVAMDNATDEVKAVADVIAPSQADDGAAWAIERYVLENTL